MKCPSSPLLCLQALRPHVLPAHCAHFAWPAHFIPPAHFAWAALFAGTPDYMSPQLTAAKTGEAGKVFYDGTKADVWAMGVLLCVILIGKFPFEVRDEIFVLRQKGILEQWERCGYFG
eukprot:scaffold60425_cov17-Tisochrysis_lutea.AAC.1